MIYRKEYKVNIAVVESIGYARRIRKRIRRRFFTKRKIFLISRPLRCEPHAEALRAISVVGGWLDSGGVVRGCYEL